jgi:hypothetical protein
VIFSVNQEDAWGGTLDLFNILNSIVSFIVGLASGFTLKIVIDRSKNKRTTTVTQNKNVVGRDLIGGDSNRK